MTTKAWVIESAGAWAVLYWNGRTGIQGPTFGVVEEAIRFSRAEDARTAAKYLAPLGRGHSVSVTEHEFEGGAEADLSLEVARLRTENEALRELIPLVDGLMMYEDKAIEAFAERKDPCPAVMTGPRKWLRRLRQTRASLKTLLKEPGR